MKKILVTGADGMLSTDFIKTAAAESGIEVSGMNRDQMDICDAASVRKAFHEIKPDWVLHAAALTDVDYCEENPEKAFRVNAEGTRNVAIQGESMGAVIVYISTCGLFGDEIKAYVETDPVELKTKYAQSKYAGEKTVIDKCSKYYIIRPGWLFGGLPHHQNNFVYQRYLEARNKSSINSVVNRYGSPTYTKHLSGKILQLLKSNYFGLYHITNSGHASSYEYVRKIIETWKLPTEVIPVDSNMFPRKAPVPDCEMLKNQRLQQKEFELLPHWHEAIEEYISEVRKKQA